MENTNLLILRCERAARASKDAQAEVQDQLARVDVWRSLLAAAVAQGDLTPFLTILKQP